MLPALHRLRSRKDFNFVYRRGKSTQTELFRIIVLERREKEEKIPITRVGVVVANKIIKKAVERNKKKRQIRACLKILLSRVKGGYDIILVSRVKIASASYQQILADIISGLQRSRLISNLSQKR